MNKLKLKREKFQAGSLTTIKRKVSGEVWVYRWREYRDDGTSTYRKQIIGPKTEMSKAAAKKVVQGLKLDINTVRSAVPTGRTVLNSLLITSNRKWTRASTRQGYGRSISTT